MRYLAAVIEVLFSWITFCLCYVRYPNTHLPSPTDVMAAITIAITSQHFLPVLPSHASSASSSSIVISKNLPDSTGATGTNRGLLIALIPIDGMRMTVADAEKTMFLSPPSIKDCKGLLDTLPGSEKEFKRLFDEYSEGISYKQQYLDKNAFIVYYTKGFDGPSRPSIEADDPMSIKQSRQYGYRNDAWVAIDDARSEVSYLLEQSSEDITDLKISLREASKAFDGYLSLVPADDLKKLSR